MSIKYDRNSGYVVTTRTTPGAAMTSVGKVGTLADARRLAAGYQGRSDLTYQDVRIERAGNEALVEYAGPCR